MTHDQDAIKRAIPHRPPFLFLDAILEHDETGLKASRKLEENESFFEGHYPGNPIMPGVLMCEAVFQAGAVFLAHRAGISTSTDNHTEEAGPTPILSRIQDARFKRIVKPGDTIEVDVRPKETMQKFHFMEGKVSVYGKIALTIQFALALVDEH